MRRWWAPATTATSLVAALVAGTLAPFPGAAGDAVQRLLAAVSAIEPVTGDLAPARLRRACGGDPRCVASRVAAIVPRARLVQVRHPDTDWIRWAKTRAAIPRVEPLADGRLLVELVDFGRTVRAELKAARAAGDGAGLVIDLRDNPGGDFGRMLGVAAELAGPVDRALYLVGRDGPSPVTLARSGSPPRSPITVLIGRATASSAEILAALLRRHGGAALVGARTAGKDYLVRIVPVDHDWRLLLPAERVRVPGETLVGGLDPDRPLPTIFN